MRVLVCGSRTFDDRSTVFTVLDGLRMGLGDDPDFIVIEGGARGADSLAREWTRAWHLPLEEYPANWDRFGKQAGYIRNMQMLDEGKPDLVVAFVDKPWLTSKGTSHTIVGAHDRNIKTIIVEVR